MTRNEQYVQELEAAWQAVREADRRYSAALAAGTTGLALRALKLEADRARRQVKLLRKTR